MAMQEKSIAEREAMLGELAHRREKQWKIFSWIASLFLAMIGGTVALKLGTPPRDFSVAFKIAITIAAVSLQVYAWLWIRQNWELERKALKKLHKLGIDFPTNDTCENYLGERRTGLVFGYLQALLLMFAALLLVIWLKPY